MLYKDKTKDIAARVEDLLARMTLKEKTAQLQCLSLFGDPEAIASRLSDGIGTISYLNSSLTGDTQKDIEALRRLQQRIVEGTRLGIPALAHSEGVAGAQVPGATTFPESIGLASTWEPGLAERMGEVVRRELAAFGIRAVHSPLFDLGRDPRWGRMGETYGEDPYLVSRMGVAYVRGIQGKDEMMATAKHFVGYGNSEGGRNGGEQQLGRRRLLDTFCLPFEAAIREAGVMGVMNCYGVLNDEPVVTSEWLLTEVLREELGFGGVVVSDYGSVMNAYSRYRVARSEKEAAILALKAGIDVDQPNGACYKHLADAVESGEIDAAYVDRAVRRVLATKFRLGLFERPYGDGDFALEAARPESATLSREIATKSIVLVKNESEILPLRKGLKIALVGPAADGKVNLFGGYSSVGTASATSSDFDSSENEAFLRGAYVAAITEYRDGLRSMGIIFDKEPSPEQKAVIMAMIAKSKKAPVDKVYASVEEFVDTYYPGCLSIKDALLAAYGEENVRHSRGCDIIRPIEGGIDAAVAVARDSDIIIAAVGGKESMRALDATCGENKDNANIGLEDAQRRLMDELFKLNKPVITIIVDGRPLAAPDVIARSAAVMYAWLPAQEGASAIADVVTGAACPSGKLPVTILKDEGQIPMHSGRLSLYTDPDNWADYIDRGANEPLLPFGHGLSYTNFAYADLRVTGKARAEGSIELSAKISNAGPMEGDETVQVYVSDRSSSALRAGKMLVGFAKLHLRVGETKEAIFEIDMRQLAFHNARMEYVVEPGEMEVFVGSSSQDIRLRGSFEILGPALRVERKVFSSKATVV